MTTEVGVIKLRPWHCPACGGGAAGSTRYWTGKRLVCRGCNDARIERGGKVHTIGTEPIAIICRSV